MITKCAKGHWYDNSVSRECPHCKAEGKKLRIGLNELEEDDRTVSLMETGISLGQGTSPGDEFGSILPAGFGVPSSLFTIPSQGADDEKTQDRTLSEIDEDKTIAFGFFNVTAAPPVVGWLVCMSGKEKGKDYRLHAGKNFVGRSTSMDVILVDDKTVSRNKHCSVIYDPKGNHFYVSAEGGNLVYLNGSMLEESTQIQEGDMVTVGKTDLMFIPFCREGRTWEKE